MFEWPAEQARIAKYTKLTEDRAISSWLSVFSYIGCELMTHDSRDSSPDTCPTHHGGPGAIGPSK